MNCNNHTPCPSGYLEFHEWAEKKSRTHKQIRCPACKLWAIWVSKKNKNKESRDEQPKGPHERH